MVNLDDLRVFVQAVDSGGFAAAARRIGAPKSTISKRVAALEEGLGARLIHRTSRSFLLTELGRDFYGHARAALIEAEAAEDVVRRRLAEPSGSVRITASVPTAQSQLAARLPALAEAHPKLLLQLHVTDRFVDLVHEGFDIAVRSHFAPLPDSGLIQRRLSAEAIILVAAPLYVARRGAPAAPADLAAHDGLLVGGDAVVWRLADVAGQAVAVSPRPRLIADESMVLMRAASAGLGIACLPESMVRAAIGQGALVRILPGCTAGTVTTTMLTTHRRGQLPAVRAVMDFLAA
ncbi:LysR substrate-binding domain-containing protein [Plastoroseomonas hellenica]|uniref:LysR substrate-binding domain-containing protein n=1 Tax=Plastoroseomonas hellenica TaxID=2687306 RepID=UPI001BA54496|nr:LysR substrate-binding domain-containing protein [Plastoroseomonas hellenica]MBR0642625.1 LysR family transcriptional regulator [Plastoroseomonas hellenica]